MLKGGKKVAALGSVNEKLRQKKYSGTRPENQDSERDGEQISSGNVLEQSSSD